MREARERHAAQTMRRHRKIHLGVSFLGGKRRQSTREKVSRGESESPFPERRKKTRIRAHVPTTSQREEGIPRGAVLRAPFEFSRNEKDSEREREREGSVSTAHGGNEETHPFSRYPVMASHYLSSREGHGSRSGYGCRVPGKESLTRSAAPRRSFQDKSTVKRKHGRERGTGSTGYFRERCSPSKEERKRHLARQEYEVARGYYHKNARNLEDLGFMSERRWLARDKSRRTRGFWLRAGNGHRTNRRCQSFHVS